MRKTIMIATWLAAMAVAQGQTVYSRPANADQPSSANVSNCYGNGTYQATPAGTFSPAWTGKAGAGPITSPSGTFTVDEDSYSQSTIVWGGSYTTFGTLTLTFDVGACSSSAGEGAVQCEAAYSTNGFATYTNLGTIGADTSFTLPAGTNLSTLQISVCQSSFETIPNTQTMTIDDIWATGTDAAPTATGQDGGTFLTGKLVYPLIYARW